MWHKVEFALWSALATVAVWEVTPYVAASFVAVRW